MLAFEVGGGEGLLARLWGKEFALGHQRVTENCGCQFFLQDPLKSILS